MEPQQQKLRSAFRIPAGPGERSGGREPERHSAGGGDSSAGAAGAAESPSALMFRNNRHAEGTVP